MARLNVLADIAKGLKANIHVVDNMSPVSRVAVCVKAGSRYEPDHLPGISHYIKAASGITTQESSVFGIAQLTERVGATFSTTHDREHVVYKIDCLRDKLGLVLKFIDDTVHMPEFRSWELVDTVQPRLKEDLLRFKKNQRLVTNEAMHKAAYRGGLAHSMFIPDFQVERIKKNDLFEYLHNNYVLDRMSFVGLGVDRDELTNTIEQQFRLNGSEYKGVSGASRYVGGEARLQAAFPDTMVNFVAEGCSLADARGLAALFVIENLLGQSDYVSIKYGGGADKTLTKLMHSYSPAITTSIVNISYVDTGLFGFSICGPNIQLRPATKAAVNHVRKQLANITDKDLEKAKKAAKARTLLQAENHSAVFDSLTRRHAAGVVGQNPLDELEKLTLKDVQTTAQSLLKSKPTIVAVGNPRFVPYMDELES